MAGSIQANNVTFGNGTFPNGTVTVGGSLTAAGQVYVDGVGASAVSAVSVAGPYQAGSTALVNAHLTLNGPVTALGAVSADAFSELTLSPSFSFLLAAADPDNPPTSGMVDLRVKIWDNTKGEMSGVVYDTQVGAAYTALPTTPLAEGVVLHGNAKGLKPLYRFSANVKLSSTHESPRIG